MSGLEFSTSTSILGKEYGGYGVEECYGMLAEAGFKWVELSRRTKEDLASLKPILEKVGLKVWSVHGFASSGLSVLDEELRQKCIREEIAWMESASVYGYKPYVIHYVYRQNNPEHGKLFRDSVDRLYERAHELGVLLVMETAPYKPWQDERYPDSKEISDFVRSYDKPDFRMTIDLNHSNVREDLGDTCRNCRGLIANIHVSDNHGEKEEHLALGEGIIDFAYAFRKLRENDYTGPCNLECHLPLGTELSVDTLRQLRLHSEELICKTGEA